MMYTKPLVTAPQDSTSHNKLIDSMIDLVEEAI